MSLIPLLTNQDFALVTLPLAEQWIGKPTTPNTMSGQRPWTTFIGTTPTPWGVENEALKLENSGTIAHGGRLELALPSSDYAVSADITEFAHPVATTLVASVCTRMQGTSDLTFYAADLVADAGVYSLALFKFFSGQTQLGSSVTLGVVTSGRLGLISSGDSHKLLWNGAVAIDETDSDIPTGLYAGIQGVANGVGNRIRMDNFTVSAVPTVHRRRQILGLAPLAGVH